MGQHTLVVIMSGVTDSRSESVMESKDPCFLTFADAAARRSPDRVGFNQVLESPPTQESTPAWQGSYDSDGSSASG